MAICDMGYEHEDPAPTDRPEPIIIEPGPNENDVKIAEIQAERDIATQKLWTEQRATELEGEVQRLRGELEGMREVLDRLALPEPAEPAESAEPEPVMIPVPAPAAPPEEEVPPPPEDKKPKARKSTGWWDTYYS
jgi:hypothetical protein